MPFNMEHRRNGKNLLYRWGIWHSINLKDVITIETLSEEMPGHYVVQGWKDSINIKELHELLTDGKKDYRKGHEDEPYPWFPNGSHHLAWTPIAGGGYAITDADDGEIMVILPGDEIIQYNTVGK